MGAYKASRVQHKSGGYSLKYPIVLINRREKIIAIHYLSMGKKKYSAYSLSIDGQFTVIHYQSIPYSMFDTTPCSGEIQHEPITQRPGG